MSIKEYYYTMQYNGVHADIATESLARLLGHKYTELKSEICKYIDEATFNKFVPN
jgi:hypothetical protein